jgi:hypothetical protein
MRFCSNLTVALAAFAFLSPAQAQIPPADLAGTYNGSQMEVGTELRLEADGRFQYYLSYGALDEMAAGRWESVGDRIALTSDKVTAPRFELVGAQSGSGGLEVTLDVPHGMPIELFEAAVRFADGNGMPASFEQARVRFKPTRGNPPASVMLAFPIYEIVSEPFPVPAGTRSMRFRFAPNDLGSVAFDHQVLPRDGESLVLERYGRTLRFRKEAPDTGGDEQVQETEEK